MGRKAHGSNRSWSWPRHRSPEPVARECCCALRPQGVRQLSHKGNVPMSFSLSMLRQSQRFRSCRSSSFSVKRNRTPWLIAWPVVPRAAVECDEIAATRMRASPHGSPTIRRANEHAVSPAISPVEAARAWSAATNPHMAKPPKKKVERSKFVTRYRLSVMN